MPNYAFTTGRELPKAENGQVFERLNFTRKSPHTKIFEGITGLTFRGCNLTNCDVPADAKVIDCLRSHIDFCTNVHPDWVEKGIAACIVNCSHVIGNDVIQVAGTTVETVYHYADKAVT